MSKEDIKEFEFKQGQSGNPNGRPKGSMNIKTIIRKLLEEEDVDFDGIKKSKGMIMTNSILRKASKGDVSAFKALVERLEGLPKQEIDQTNTHNFVKMPTIKTKDQEMEIDIGD